MDVEGEDLDLEPATGVPPSSAYVPAAPNRRSCRSTGGRRHRSSGVGQVRRADVVLALAVLAVTGDAIGGEDLLARLRSRSASARFRLSGQATGHRRRRPRSCSRSRMPSRPNASICETRVSSLVELMPTRIVSAIVSGSPPHSQRLGGQVGEARSAGAVDAVAGRAIVAEQRAAGLAHIVHQRRVGLDRGEIHRADPVGPGRALRRRALDLACHDLRAGRCRAGPSCRSSPAARPASAASSRRRTACSPPGRTARPAAPAY